MDLSSPPPALSALLTVLEIIVIITQDLTRIPSLFQNLDTYRTKEDTLYPNNIKLALEENDESVKGRANEEVK